ncbi:MAG: hypothetical protein KZQ83_05770 [gamma proteobacterium symbiont of Taylorina sp.]|nr:hypothetical protein [gamma proteobacterium symbiont of Taylorina sp.]
MKKFNNTSLCYFFSIGIFFSFLLTGTVFSTPPPDPNEVSIPLQLRLIRAHLDEMTDQMTTMDKTLKAKMDEIEVRRDEKFIEVQATADNIHHEVTAVNIEMTTQLCFDASAKMERNVGVAAEVGVGWDAVLTVHGTVQGDGGFGSELSVSNQICIEVPLYSVESYDQLFTSGEDLDGLIAALAYPSQAVVPVIAEVYTALMPTPDQAFEALGNVTEASTGYDIYSGTSPSPRKFYPADLLKPDLLLDPIKPQFVKDFEEYAPTAVDIALNDPCSALAATPIGVALRKPNSTDMRDDVNFLCEASANSLQTAMSDVNEALSEVNGVVTGITGTIKTEMGKVIAPVKTTVNVIKNTVSPIKTVVDKVCSAVVLCKL